MKVEIGVEVEAEKEVELEVDEDEEKEKKRKRPKKAISTQAGQMREIDGVPKPTNQANFENFDTLFQIPNR